MNEKQAAAKAHSAANDGDFAHACDLLSALVHQNALPRPTIDYLASLPHRSAASLSPAAVPLNTLARAHFSMMSTLFDAAVGVCRLDIAVRAASKIYFFKKSVFLYSFFFFERNLKKINKLYLQVRQVILQKTLLLPLKNHKKKNNFR